jgi:hypothetical protein
MADIMPELSRAEQRERLMACSIEVGQRLAGTAIPNHLLVVALMNVALAISERDALSQEVYLATLAFQSKLAAGSLREAGHA